MVIFAITIFISAFLLFQVQPLISRYILPWFGGTPAVWSASLLFFQTLLLAGYAYAHRIANRTSRLLRFHVLLLASSVALLLLSALWWGSPLLPDAAWKPPDASQPFLRVVILLLVSTGLPYFVLSSTSPLLQAWHETLYPYLTPYRLYALSNLGSFLALITYPFIVEPQLDLAAQARIWSGAYLLFAGLCAGLAWRMLAANRRPATANPVQAASSDLELAGTPGNPSLFQRLMWVALPACTSILLLSITNQLTQEVAVIPFLWILPLSLYLLSFSIAFSGEGWYRRPIYLGLLGVATLLLSYVIDRLTTIGVLPQIAIFSFFLFMATLVLHTELYRLRPEPRRLTSFYLLVSLGGALGGLFVNLVAPLIFLGYWELHLGVLFCGLLVLALLVAGPRFSLRSRTVWLSVPVFAIVAGVTGMVLINHIRGTLAGVQTMRRNFYGVIRVRLISAGEPPLEAYSLSHGITSHGFQFRQPENRAIPTSYYSGQSGIGLALDYYTPSDAENPLPQGLKVGVIGLGTGTLATYGRKGDTYRFYELNPDVIDLAQGASGYFSYQSDSRAAIEIVPGDGRLSLEQEMAEGQPQGFDILAVDAFSGDSIPVHLLTEEAFRVYLEHLKPGGILAIHVSNRYLDLEPLVRALGDHYQLAHAVVASPATERGAYAAVWVLLSPDAAFFQQPGLAGHFEDPSASDLEIRLWTDHYSNMLQVVRQDVFFRLR